MERTESTVIQVAPAYENDKIEEMEMFGWSLQSRQEIHEEGDAYARPSIWGNEYIIKKRVSRYVKLHFVRSLSLPNLDKVKQIEVEYVNLIRSLPPLPSPNLAVGAFFAGVLILGIVRHIVGPVWGVVISIFVVSLVAYICAWYGRRYKQCQRRAEELINQLKPLGYGPSV